MVGLVGWCVMLARRANKEREVKKGVKKGLRGKKKTTVCKTG